MSPYFKVWNMAANTYPDVAALESALDAVENDVRALVSGLTGESGAWRADALSWSVAECLDHLAIANRVYLAAMRPAAERALAGGRRRRGPAVPGIVGQWFVWTLEPPVKPQYKMKAPRLIRPRQSPALHDAVAGFLASQNGVRSFLREFADIDLAGVR